MASAEFQFDTRIRRYHVPLKTQQRRVRHLRSIAARNIVLKDTTKPGLYYSLHQMPSSDAFYTSEIIFDSLNPTWKDFEPSSLVDDIMILSSPYMTVKVWDSNHKLLVEWILYFSGLQFLGKQVPKEGSNFKCNTLIFGMLEGYYGCSDCFEHVPEKSKDYAFKETIPADASNIRTSCAFSTLGRIKTFERVISQIQATSQRWKRNIESKLQEAEKLHEIRSCRELLQIKVSMLQVEVERQKLYFMSLENDVAVSQEKLFSDQLALKNLCDELHRAKSKLSEIGHIFWDFRENLLKTEAHLVYRRKELITDLCRIYPIVQFPDHKGYSIHNVHLPNSENLSGHDEMMISVALGYVCHVVLMISHFLNVPLRYEVQFSGSKSTIIDHISSTIPVKNRVFPLYSKGKDRRFFEYGVYLLNKNIAQLRILFGLTSKELSATLPNLHGLIQQRLSFLHDLDSLPVSTTSLPASSLQGNLKSATVSQNGLSYNGNSYSNIPRKILEHSNSEIENLKREMAEMMPSAMGSSESNSIIPNQKNDMPNAFRGSLDKGLNDLRVLESNEETLLPRNLEKLPMKQIGQAFHHSSYPNLNSSIQQLDKCGFNQAVSGSPQNHSTPLKMWITGGSHTNSEEEPIEESFAINSTQETRDSCFYVPQEWATFQNDSSALLKSEQIIPIESVMLEEHAFSEDLTLRAEQLASRSSSFQMQKSGSLSNDSAPLHPT